MSYTIQDFRFDPSERTIIQGDKCVTLNHRTAQVFELFALHPNETLSRDKIITDIWVRDCVSDHSLTQAISDLRKALVEINPNYKKLIKTKPKAGYMLEAVVLNNSAQTRNDGNCSSEVLGVHLTNEMPIIQLFRTTSLWLKIAAILCVIAFFAGLWASHAPQKPQVNPYKLAFITFNSPEKYNHIAFGLSDLINYRINQQGHFRSSLIYDNNSEFSTSAALVISGSIVEQESQSRLLFYIDDNLSGDRIFEEMYSVEAKDLVTTPKKILEDIEANMQNIFDHSIITQLNSQYPSEPEQLNLMHQAHYAFNQINPRSLYHAVKLYEEVLKSTPTLEIAAAERLIATKILIGIQEKSFSIAEYDTMYQEMMAIDDPLHPPIYYEALAIYHFDKLDLSLAKTWLDHAVNIRESWLSNIIIGKIAEAEKKDFQASMAYKRAISMKPDQSTMLVIQSLMFETDLKSFRLGP